MKAIDDADGWTTWPAPAKLNLFLRVVGRREDGYHELQTVFRLLEWGDRIRLRPRLDGDIHRHGTTVIGLSQADDLAIRAAKLLQTESNCVQGADIVVEKNIPAGAGFGGGSSDAATVLHALNVIWGIGLTVERLADLGLRLGADVPLFVHGRNAWAEGVGERLTPIDLPARWYLLASPQIHVDTATLFRAPDLTRDSTPATISDFVSSMALDNRVAGNCFESLLRRREPAVEAMFAVLTQACESWGCRPQLTGTGSGCFVEFADRESAETALAALPPGSNAWVAAGAARSSLLEAIETNRLQGRRQEV